MLVEEIMQQIIVFRVQYRQRAKLLKLLLPQESVLILQKLLQKLHLLLPGQESITESCVLMLWKLLQKLHLLLPSQESITES